MRCVNQVKKINQPLHWKKMSEWPHGIILAKLIKWILSSPVSGLTFCRHGLLHSQSRIIGFRDHLVWNDMSRVAQLSSNWHKCFLSPEPLFLPPHTASEESSEAVTLTTKQKINKAATSSVYLKQLIHNKVPANDSFCLVLFNFLSVCEY